MGKEFRLSMVQLRKEDFSGTLRINPVLSSQDVVLLLVKKKRKGTGFKSGTEVFVLKILLEILSQP